MDPIRALMRLVGAAFVLVGALAWMPAVLVWVIEGKFPEVSPDQITAAVGAIGGAIWILAWRDPRKEKLGGSP